MMPKKKFRTEDVQRFLTNPVLQINKNYLHRIYLRSNTVASYLRESLLRLFQKSAPWFVDRMKGFRGSLDSTKRKPQSVDRKLRLGFVERSTTYAVKTLSRTVRFTLRFLGQSNCNENSIC
jgi:hypothetical protein